VVGVALLPATGNLSVLRALRILRVLRIIGMVPSLKRVVGGLVAALPGMGSIMLLLTLVFYVFSVMATKLYGESFPEWFGSIPASAYSLFQIMTLESWSMGIVRPVMEVHPMAWTFFIPFIPAPPSPCSTCSSASSFRPCRPSMKPKPRRPRSHGERTGRDAQGTQGNPQGLGGVAREPHACRARQPSA
jgi:hypothetical protein